MSFKPLIVGISGVTNGGKSTLIDGLRRKLRMSNEMKFLYQDDYYYSEDSPRHIPSPGGIKHHNWEVITSLDMDKMLLDIKAFELDSTNHSNLQISSRRDVFCGNRTNILPSEKGLENNSDLKNGNDLSAASRNELLQAANKTETNFKVGKGSKVGLRKCTDKLVEDNLKSKSAEKEMEISASKCDIKPVDDEQNNAITLCSISNCSKSVSTSHKLSDSVFSGSLNRPILLLDGFTLYANETIANLCDLKFFITLTKEDCRARRDCRHYDPPDIPGYFDACVWPEYVQHLNFIRLNYSDVCFLDGMVTKEDLLSLILDKIFELLPKTD